MALRASNYRTARKPVDEPFRDWALEVCVHCESHIPLDRHKCPGCGYVRNQLDQNMADKVLTWRKSPQGQASWKSFNQFQQDQAKADALLDNLFKLFMIVVMFLGGFIIFGLVGLFFEMGLILGIIGGSAMAYWTIKAG